MIYSYLANQSPTLFQVAPRRTQTTGRSSAPTSPTTPISATERRRARARSSSRRRSCSTPSGATISRADAIGRCRASSPCCRTRTTATTSSCSRSATWRSSRWRATRCATSSSWRCCGRRQAKPAEADRDAAQGSHHRRRDGRDGAAAQGGDGLDRGVAAQGSRVPARNSRWGQIGLGALSLGCIGAAATGVGACGRPALRGRRGAGVGRAEILRVAAVAAPARRSPSETKLRGWAPLDDTALRRKDSERFFLAFCERCRTSP